MKDLSIKHLVIILTIFCIPTVMLQSAWTRSMDGQDLKEVEKGTIQSKGTVNQINETRIIIDDQEFSLSPNTQYLKNNGKKTGRNFFTKGTVVFYVRNRLGQLLSLYEDKGGEQRVKSENTQQNKREKNTANKRKNKNSEIILDNGVWRN